MYSSSCFCSSVSSAVLGGSCTLALLKSSSLLELLKSSSLSSSSLSSISSSLLSWSTGSISFYTAYNFFSGAGYCHRDRPLLSGRSSWTFAGFFPIGSMGSGSYWPSFMTSSNLASFFHFYLSFRIYSRSKSRYNYFSSTTGFGFFGVSFSFGCCCGWG